MNRSADFGCTSNLRASDGGAVARRTLTLRRRCARSDVEPPCRAARGCHFHRRWNCSPHPKGSFVNNLNIGLAGLGRAASLRIICVARHTARFAPSTQTHRFRNMMKTMDSARGPGANHSDTHLYRADLQRRDRVEDAFSCFEICGSEYWHRIPIQQLNIQVISSRTLSRAVGATQADQPKVELIDRPLHNAPGPG